MTGSAEPAGPKAPHPPVPGRPRLSVIVPAYGEGGRIGRTIAALREGLGDETEIVVVDDGSPDDTSAQARAAGADQVLTLSPNRGKGGAVRAGMLAAEGSALVFTDADLSYSPAQVDRVRAEIERGWDVVVGSRQHVDARAVARSRFLREISGRVFNLLTRLVLRHPLADTQCGLKGFHHDTADLLFTRARIDGFAFDVELLSICEHLGIAVREVPVEVANVDGSTVRLKVDVARMVRDLLRIRRLAREGAYDASTSVTDEP